MKKIMILLFSAVIALSGISVLAGHPMGKPEGERKEMRQLDEIDKLLILVRMQERKQCRQEEKRGHREMKAKKCGACPMMGKKDRCQCEAGKDCRKECGPDARKDRRMECKKDRGEHNDRRDMKREGGKRHLWKRSHEKNAELKACLLKNYSKEMDEIVKLKKANDEAGKEILSKFEKLVDKAQAELKAEREKKKAEHQEFAKMVEEYKQSKDAKLAEKIKAKISEFYDLRLERMKNKIDENAADVQKAYDKLKEKKENKEKEVSEKFERITK